MHEPGRMPPEPVAARVRGSAAGSVELLWSAIGIGATVLVAACVATVDVADAAWSTLLLFGAAVLVAQLRAIRRYRGNAPT